MRTNPSRPLTLFAARAAVIGIAALTALAALALVLAPNDSTLRVGAALQPASIAAPLGTDGVGRDELSRLMHGAGLLWLPAMAIALTSAALGGLIGLVAGAVGGWTEALLRGLTNAMRALPAPVMAVAVAAAAGPGLRHLATALVLFGWPGHARLVREAVAEARTMPFSDAAALSGVGSGLHRVVFLVPVMLPVLGVSLAFDLAATVLTLALLSFLRLGALSPVAELGSMTADGLDTLLDLPLLTALPILAVFALALAALLAADLFRRRLEQP